MQVSVECEGRKIRQYGAALGELEGCVVEEVSAETYAAILAALPAHGAGVTLSADHATVTPLEEDPAEIAARVAREAEDAAIREMVAAHPDPLVRLLAQRLRLG